MNKARNKIQHWQENSKKKIISNDKTLQISRSLSSRKKWELVHEIPISLIKYRDTQQMRERHLHTLVRTLSMYDDIAVHAVAQEKTREGQH